MPWKWQAAGKSSGKRFTDRKTQLWVNKEKIENALLNLERIEKLYEEEPCLKASLNRYNWPPTGKI